VGESLSLIPAASKQILRRNGLCIDFLSGRFSHRLKSSGKRELLAKALGIKKYGLPLKIIDTTAGLGQDAFMMANLGCQVLMLERSAIIYLLLKNALARANKSKPTVVKRLTLMHTQAEIYLKTLLRLPKRAHPDVIYLDPMYPTNKRSHLPNKAAYILKTIVGEDKDAATLLKAALACYPKRVVLKRPRLGKTLLSIQPPLQLVGKTIRFDIFFPKQT
jgi:16S rRNA (guanine1516-N2)-methyltransferase